MAVSFVSIEDLREWIAEMRPRSIVVEVSPSKDSGPLAAALERVGGATLH